MNQQQASKTPSWRVAIDTGGTFTDGIGQSPDGRIHRTKVLSSSAIRATIRASSTPTRHGLDLRDVCPPEGLFSGFLIAQPGGPVLGRVLDHPLPDEVVLEPDLTLPVGTLIELRAPYDAPRLALHLLLNTTPSEPLPPLELRVATTRGTNALLEARGASFALVVDAGLEDQLVIGDQSRPDLFALNIHRQRLSPTCVLGVSTRLDQSGVAPQVLTEEQLDQIASELISSEAEAVGVSLVHGWKNPQHERTIAEGLAARGVPVAIAATELSLAEGLTARTETLAVEASIRPVLTRFLDGILDPKAPQQCELLVMSSAGGLTAARRFKAKDGLLSGPAGGVVGAAQAAESVGTTRLLGFDMGGTSTDVSRYDQEMLYRFETRVGPARVQAPCVAIETVAAGGGSICHWCNHGLAVGPQSAGADPGPACYGAGGPLTLTDVNLLLGRADPDSFGVPLDEAAAQAALDRLLDVIEASQEARPAPEAVLLGLLDIANERMAEAMRAISIREGADPAQHVLIPFGGAGGQHACAIAQRLGINRILLPTDTGILSARGVLLARNEQFSERTINLPLDTFLDELQRLRNEIESEAASNLPSVAHPSIRTLVGMRLNGQDDVIQIDLTDTSELRREFVARFEENYGYPPPDRTIEVAWIRARATDDRRFRIKPDTITPRTRTEPLRTANMILSDETRDVEVIRRDQLEVDIPRSGPLLLVEDGATIVIEPGWNIFLDDTGTVTCTSTTPHSSGPHLAGAEGVAGCELVSARLESIAVAMGRLLERTALSVNVKQRLDFSCALLDAQGRLLVNAPHMPIHLGSMGLCVRRTLESITPQPGDVLITNHPGCGGSHLPDITTIAPIHESPSGGALLGFAAVRAHHAEIGGARPGSTPPFAANLAEEGVLITPRHLVRDGQPEFDRIEALLTSGPWPSRRPDENIADLRAQLAATSHGVERLRNLAEGLGTEPYLRRAARVRDNAARVAQRAIRALGDLDRTVRQELDDGATIHLHAFTRNDRLTLDFTGSSAVHRGNFNAPIAIVTGACVYLMRLLADTEVPMNEGLLEPVDLIVPEGMLNPSFGDDPEDSPAVCAGNTETSQRITDTLLLAFDLAACSQGTMNNLLFGNAHQGYYETISGGAGATAQAPGCSAVHTHMTNTRITDPEILETRFPVQLVRFSIRPGSGGAGLHAGGDGVIRSIRALEPIEVSFVSQHRTQGPYGLHGGRDGSPGNQYLVLADGSRHSLAGCDQCVLEIGDTVTVETPGGGGWGSST